MVNLQNKKTFGDQHAPSLLRNDGYATWPRSIARARYGRCHCRKDNEVLVEHTAIGVNFVDIYLRAGQAHSHNPEPPFINRC
jgi:hypothetical protein